MGSDTEAAGRTVEVETGVDVDEWSHTNDHSTVLEVDMQEWVVTPRQQEGLWRRKREWMLMSGVTPMTTALCWKLTCRSG